MMCIYCVLSPNKIKMSSDDVLEILISDCFFIQACSVDAYQGRLLEDIELQQRELWRWCACVWCAMVGGIAMVILYFAII